jgi:NAD(P)-dependent dehydrogenase (short-subunit alcohol dehydrogenase family)
MRGVAVLAGGDQRLGRAVVERLRREGLKVATVGPQQVGADLTIEVRQLSDRRKMKEAAAQVEEELGEVSLLITAPPERQAAAAPFGTLAAEGWQSLLDSYLGGATAACAAFVPAMVHARRGCVISLSSSLAILGTAGQAYAAAASGAIVGFTKSFAAEVARHGVRVNCIAAGPDGRVSAEAIADTVLFLFKDGDFFVGQVLSPGATG